MSELVDLYYKNKGEEIMNNITKKEPKENMAKWMMGLLILNLCLTIYVIPPNFVFDSEPIGFVDYMQHYNHADNFVKMVREGGSTWSYNPKYMAGFPDLTLFDMDNRFVELFALLGSVFGIGAAVSLKIVLFLELFIEPFLLYFAFSNFQFKKKSCLWACLGGIFILNGPMGLFFNIGGMFSYIFAVFLSFFIVSLYYKKFILGKKEQDWMIIAFTALAPIFHVTSIFMIGIPVLFFLGLRYREIKSPQIKFLGLDLGVTVFVNLYWIIPVLKTIQYSIVNDYAWTGDFSFVQFVVMWGGATLFVMGGFFSILFLGRSCRALKKEKKELMYLSLFMIVLILLSGGPLWYFTRSMQPNRFLIVLQLYLLLPAIALLEQIFIEKSVRAIKGMLAVLILSILLPGAGVAYLRFAPPGDSMLLNMTHKMLGRRMDAGNVADDRTVELVGWLNNNTSVDQGRIMLQHLQGEEDESVANTFYLGLLPAIDHYVEGEFLGAPRFEVPMKQSRSTRFSHDEMFGEILEEMSREEFQYKLELYNVKWIVAIGSTANDYFDKYPELLTLREQIDTARIYEVTVENTEGYFLKGHGNIKAEIGRIELTNLTGDEIIIKYHWMNGLKAPEGVEIEKYPVEGDEVGFIKLINPPQKVILEF